MRIEADMGQPVHVLNSKPPPLPEPTPREPARYLHHHRLLSQYRRTKAAMEVLHAFHQDWYDARCAVLHYPIEVIAEWHVSMLPRRNPKARRTT